MKDGGKNIVNVWQYYSTARGTVSSTRMGGRQVWIRVKKDTCFWLQRFEIPWRTIKQQGKFARRAMLLQAYVWHFLLRAGWSRGIVPYMLWTGGTTGIDKSWHNLQQKARNINISFDMCLFFVLNCVTIYTYRYSSVQADSMCVKSTEFKRYLPVTVNETLPQIVCGNTKG